MKTCPKSSPNIVECLKNAIDAIKPYLKNGEIAPGFKIEGTLSLVIVSACQTHVKFHNYIFPGIDPLNVGNVSINQGFEVNHWGMKAYGISDFKVDKMRVNLDNFKVGC